MPEKILKMKEITKIFPGIKALDNVDIEVEKGEIHALLGENGAGKSTLMNVLSGGFPYGSYTGEIYFEGELCKFHNVKDSDGKGIAVIHQEPTLIPELSIAENVFIGNERKGLFGISWLETFRSASTLLKMVGFDENLSVPVGDISPGKQQLVEIAKALGKNVKLLILDEPTSSLNETETEHLLNLLAILKAEGITSVLISHKVKDVAAVADKITVLRDGRTIETFIKDDKTGDFNEDSIMNAMVGRSLTERFPPRKKEIGDVVLEVRDWTVYHPNFESRKVCDGVNLTVRKGEIVGLAGLIGSGRSELAMSIFGKSWGKNISGAIFLNGKQVKLNSVRSAIAHHLAYVSEDRHGNGLLLNDSIAANTTLANMKRISRFMIIRNEKERVIAEKFRRKLGIKSFGISQEVGTLSGGNQQKVLLGKWLFTEPDILILDEPTSGIDVGAKYEIYTIINNLVAKGQSVMLISSEMPELLGMCDRIYVMNEGRIVGELAQEEASQEAIMNCILQSGKSAY